MCDLISSQVPQSTCFFNFFQSDGDPVFGYLGARLHLEKKYNFVFFSVGNTLIAGLL